jgi:LAS superfamily LD-carboxypeptidase LdcB
MKKRNFAWIIPTGLLLAALGAGGYFYYQNFQIKRAQELLSAEFSDFRASSSSTIDNLDANLASTTGILASTSADLQEARVERDDFEQKFNYAFVRLNLLLGEMQNIQQVVSDWEKLQGIDTELLEKYSKVYFLNENYSPRALFKVPSQYGYNPKSNYFVYDKIWPFLQEMFAAAGTAGIDLKINSAYRSFYDQADLKTYYTIVYGSGANRFSADQGYSEHQLGTTLDFSTSVPGGNISDFQKTATYQWLLKNAYKYGFIISYPENNSYYVFEPWHWRFVGRDLAAKLHQEGKNFYDMDQREIDTYLIKFFD